MSYWKVEYVDGKLVLLGSCEIFEECVEIVEIVVIYFDGLVVDEMIVFVIEYE